MFTEFLEKHNLSDILIFPALCPFPSMEDRAAWDGVDGEIRRGLLEAAQMWRERPFPMLTAGQYRSFLKDGNRKVFEEPYFDRRRKLCAALAEACLTGDESRLDAVVDGVWCILEETSWVISAHNEKGRFGVQPLPDDLTPRIDLFCAQTGMILSLCSAMAGPALNRVSPLICDRIAREAEKRILIPFETTDDHWWMGVVRKDLNNWTPWIISNVMLTACLLIREDKARLAALLTRACVMLDRYLACMPEDGGCDEGMGYWNLAGGMLVDILELLETQTAGKVKFKGSRKLENILSFPLYAYLGNGWCINFADCDARPEICGERIARAGEMLGLPQLTAFGAAHQMEPIQNLQDTPQLWRMLNAVFHRLPTEKDTVPEKDVWLPDLQVRCLTRTGVTLVCKAGHNGESHNHNDVGSFMIFADGEPEIVDAGNMTYTAKTFSGERYTLWNTRSMYHNLPLIGGAEQLPGADRRAGVVACQKDGLTLDMAVCYPEEIGVRECKRTLSLSVSGEVTVSDSIQINQPQPVQWVYMLRHAPVIGQGIVRTGSLTMRFPSDLIVNADEIPITDARMARSFPGSLWRMTVEAPASAIHDAVFSFMHTAC